MKDAEVRTPVAGLKRASVWRSVVVFAILAAYPWVVVAISGWSAAADKRMLLALLVSPGAAWFVWVGVRRLSQRHGLAIWLEGSEIRSLYFKPRQLVGLTRVAVEPDRLWGNSLRWIVLHFGSEQVKIPEMRISGGATTMCAALQAAVPSLPCEVR